MNLNIITDKLNILKQRETYANVKKNIDNGVATEGTNLWILVFAILIASLGLNINSPAVVIGAMLISPLIGPIVGVGFGVATNDRDLIKRGIINYSFSTFIGILASAAYFMITPIADAHSELLARISPTIYDVLIALFGGFAGVIAMSSKQKGNVIPGVAIATAIMPPLCTAGYGLATWQMNFFFGAFYLFLINSVFICVATLITTRYLRFRRKKYDDPKIEKREKFITYSLIALTLIPSIYLGYTLVQKNNFEKSAEEFIAKDAHFLNNFLLRRKIDADSKSITLTYGGRVIAQNEIDDVQGRMEYYDLKEATLTIQNGFAFDNSLDDKQNAELEAINLALGENAIQKLILQTKIDSLETRKKTDAAILKELLILYPEVNDGIIANRKLEEDPTGVSTTQYIAVLSCPKDMEADKKETLEKWLKARLESKEVEIVFKTD